MRMIDAHIHLDQYSDQELTCLLDENRFTQWLPFRSI
ncbi:hypothetical protein QFZ87_003309 [Bacillus sp. SLBN-46]|nr:hypothetical protein [Bacillus sp. SLBN-46]